ncbi:SURF1 family protein [Leucobacter luti]|uniref:SURF1-like protein n=1 Tax=Leucobacter luti TaxID=340320 RepID=A0A4Q7TK74_9MICO|nr:SURF1 family protein [Leucobacter luti]MBL3700285.1 SURF1 family protein [Leucobacter luti]RZT60991.1 cytochrome oxidase assembly protein ShyY1 [Leucobacter luti]
MQNTQDPTQAQRSEAQRSEPQSAPVPQPGWSFLRSSRWFGYFVMLLIFSIACVFLGNWQFDRRAEARAEIDRLDANYGSEAAPLAEELPTLDSFSEDDQKWRTVWVSGEYIGDPVLARNRPGPDGVGSDLIQALRTEDGNVFFIDRGWVPVDGGSADSGEVGIADLPQSPTGTVRVEARLRASEPEIAGRTSSGITVPSIEVPELAELTGTTGEVYTGAYGMLVSESPSAEHGVLPAEPERDEGPHLSYALQWYVFIIIAAIGVAIAARREYRSLNAGSQIVQDQDRRAAERRTKRGPTDADVEDALLDA